MSAPLMRGCIRANFLSWGGGCVEVGAVPLQCPASVSGSGSSGLTRVAFEPAERQGGARRRPRRPGALASRCDVWKLSWDDGSGVEKPMLSWGDWRTFLSYPCGVLFLAVSAMAPCSPVPVLRPARLFGAFLQAASAPRFLPPRCALLLLLSRHCVYSRSR
jgi:hypothetical protein